MAAEPIAIVHVLSHQPRGSEHGAGPIRSAGRNEVKVMVDAQNERASAAAPHILAMNNDASVLQLFRDLLEEENYRVSTHAYLDKDLSVILDLAPDLIVVDYMWPGDDNGWSLLQMLRMDPRTAPVPIVLCTAAVREVEALETHLADLRVAVVIKPFELQTLLDTIAALLAKEPASDV